MNWNELKDDKAALLTHWQKISQFRARHPAIGAGQQTTLPASGYYAFSRQYQQDKVMVVWAGNPARFI
jgi:alpha-amylase